MTKFDIIQEIGRLISNYLQSEEYRKSKVNRLKEIRTSDVIIDEREIVSVLKVLLSGWITQGSITREFEDSFARYYGVRHAISVNSGSSANLVSLAALTHESLGSERLRPGDEVITSPVTFPTSVYPIVQVGAIPVFVDVDETLCINPDLIEEALSDKTKLILPVHLMGHPCDMRKIESYGYPILEDACESHGAECFNKKVGTWGLFGTFSLFAAHHITTGEGGMILTDDDKLADLARSIRAFGRVIEVARDPQSAQTLGVRWKRIYSSLGHFDIRQTFDKLGYALKMTDIEAAIGIEQLKKLDSFIEQRRRNALYLRKGLEHYQDFIELPVEKSWARHTYHHFWLIVREDAPFTRLELVNYLESAGIETRPIEAGNMVDQPVMRNLRYRVVGNLKRARLVRKNGFFIGCHPGISREQLDYVISIFEKFFKKFINKRRS